MDPEAFRNSPAGRVVRTAGGYWAFVPNPLPPRIPWTSELAIALSEADRALGELAGLGRSLPNPHLLIRPFVRREAVLSSRIEGTQATLFDLYAYEAVQLAMFKPPPDVHEVYNYVRALEYIREVHARLMEGVRGEHQTPGEFRRSQNWIGPSGTDSLPVRSYPPFPGRQWADRTAAHHPAAVRLGCTSRTSPVFERLLRGPPADLLRPAAGGQPTWRVGGVAGLFPSRGSQPGARRRDPRWAAAGSAGAVSGAVSGSTRGRAAVASRGPAFCSTAADGAPGGDSKRSPVRPATGCTGPTRCSG